MVTDQDLEGVWYDVSSGDFCKLRVSEDGNSIYMYTPDMEDCYHEFDVDQWTAGSIRDDMYRVEDEAVKDPAGYYQDFLASVLDDIHYPVEFMYADRHTEVVEASDE